MFTNLKRIYDSYKAWAAPSFKSHVCHLGWELGIFPKFPTYYFFSSSVHLTRVAQFNSRKNMYVVLW